MKKTWLLFALLLLPILVAAQRYRTIELKPITKQGWNYAYDLNRVTSPDALQIPLMSLQDEEVNRYYKSSRTLRTVGGVITIIPFVYIVSLPRNSYVDSSTFWILIGGTILAQIGFEAWSHAKLGKAIDRYNILILKPSGQSLGVQLTWKFL